MSRPAAAISGITLLSLLGLASAQVCPSEYGPCEHEVHITVQAASGEVQARTFFVHVPDNLPPTMPQPALVSFHGCGGNVAPPWPDFEVGTRLNVATARRQWFNIYPLGTSATGGSLGWNWPGTGACTTTPMTRSSRVQSWHGCPPTSASTASGSLPWAFPTAAL